MKVRALQDGHYGGYYRLGPIIGDQGSFAGEVFEIKEENFPILDMETGKPVFELSENGKVVIDQKTNKPKIKMGSWFSPDWMEKVSDDTPITYDYPPFQIPTPYRALKASGAGTMVPKPGQVGSGSNSVI